MVLALWRAVVRRVWALVAIPISSRIFDPFQDADTCTFARNEAIRFFVERVGLPPARKCVELTVRFVALNAHSPITTAKENEIGFVCAKKLARRL